MAVSTLFHYLATVTRSQITLTTFGTEHGTESVGSGPWAHGLTQKRHVQKNTATSNGIRPILLEWNKIEMAIYIYILFVCFGQLAAIPSNWMQGKDPREVHARKDKFRDAHGSKNRRPLRAHTEVWERNWGECPRRSPEETLQMQKGPKFGRPLSGAIAQYKQEHAR